MENPSGIETASRDCGDCPIRRQAICSRCQADELLVLDRMKTYRSYAKGEMISHAGDPVSHVGTLVSGVASISRGLEDGRRQIMGILLPSDFVGRPGGRTAQYDIAAVTDLLMCRFEIGAFEKLLKTSPSLGPRFLEMTMDELDAAREWMLLLGRKSAREKIASLLHIIAVKTRALNGDDGNRLRFALPLGRGTLADYLGLTTETVSRQITSLRKDGLIETEGQRRVTILDLQRLLDETGDNSGEAAAMGPAAKKTP